MRFLPILFVLGLFLIPGCADRPEIAPQNYGKIVSELPTIKEAEEPFPFPYTGDNDHSQCVFKEEDFF